MFALLGGALRAEDAPDRTEVLISVAEQKMVVLRDGMWVQRFPVSTSKFGLGDSYGSYKTPLGKLRVCSKIGDGLPVGSVMRHRSATGEVLPANSRGRDPIVTRIMWLEGLEGCNENARARGIYIHGTVEEAKIGKPVSYGCIRMRSQDVMNVFDEVPVGTVVTIQQDKLPRLKRWSPPPPQPVIVMKEPVKPAPKTEPAAPASKGEPKTVLFVSERKSEPLPVAEKKPAPEKVAVAEKEKPTATLASHKVPEKTVPTKTSYTVASNTSSLPARNPVIIRSSGAAEESKLIPGDAGAAAALRESILFADLPKHPAH